MPVRCLIRVFQEERLTIANVPERDQLLRELRAFTVKMPSTTGRERFEADKQSSHDDTVYSPRVGNLAQREGQAQPRRAVHGGHGGGDSERHGWLDTDELTEDRGHGALGHERYARITERMVERVVLAYRGL
jgi:hypothetical protein